MTDFCEESKSMGSSTVKVQGQHFQWTGRSGVSGEGMHLVVQLHYHEGGTPCLVIYGTMPIHFDEQRTFKRADMCALSLGSCHSEEMHTDNFGEVQALGSGEISCFGLQNDDANRWAVI